MVEYNPPTYDGDEPFPQFAQSIGWVLCGWVLCPIPIWFFYHFYKTYTQNSSLPFSQVCLKNCKVKFMIQRNLETNTKTVWSLLTGDPHFQIQGIETLMFYTLQYLSCSITMVIVYRFERSFLSGITVFFDILTPCYSNKIHFT